MSIYCSYTPRMPLAAFIDSFWFCANGTQPHQKERRLPQGLISLVIDLHADIVKIYDQQDESRYQSFRGGVLCGAYATFFIIDTACQEAIMGVSFKAGGAAPFLPFPASELYNTHVSLETLWGTAAHELRAQLLEARTLQARFRILEQFLQARMLHARPLSAHPAVAFALAELQRPAYPRSIAEVTEQTGLSSRRFIEVFSAAVGLTPKQFQRVRRFQEVLSLLARGEQMAWTDIAMACGYFDQAHFIHDFRTFSGLTPGVYLPLRGAYRNHIALPG